MNKIKIKQSSLDKTRRWHVTISCQPGERPPQPVRPWKSGGVHLGEGSNVVVLELPYSTEFEQESRKFASGVRKYEKFSHFLTHPVVYGGQGKTSSSVGRRQGKNWRGGCGGWTPTGKQITPTANAREKS